MESSRVDLISLQKSSIPDLSLRVENHDYSNLPIPPGASLVSCKQAAEARNNGGVLLLALKVICVKPRIKDIPVRVERTKLVVEDMVTKETVDLFMLGLYSANVERLRVMEEDVAFVLGASVSRTRIQPKQLQPAGWAVYVGQELFKKEQPTCQVIFVRSRAGEKDLGEDIVQSFEVEENSEIVNPVASTSKAIVADLNDVMETNGVNAEAANSGDNSKVNPDNVINNTKVNPDTVVSNFKVNPDNNVADKVIPQPPPESQVPVRKPQSNTPKVTPLPSGKVYKYTDLKQCIVHKSRYNTWAVVKEVVELPTRRKTKLVARLLILDESLDSWGDMKETYKFSVLANSMEAMPPLATGAVLRIHHMVAEVFNGVADGRVYDAGGVVVVEGKVGENIKPVSSKQDMVWAEADEERVRELRQFYQELFVTDMKLEEIVGEVVFNLLCVVTAVIAMEEGTVLRVEDGTKHKLFTLVWNNPGEKEEEAGGGADFVDVFVTHKELLGLVKNGQVGVGSYLKLFGVRCRQHRRVDSQGQTMEYCDTLGNNVVGFEFVLENEQRRSDGVEVLHGGDRRAEIIKQRIKDREEFNKTDSNRENVDVNNTDMDIDALIAAVNTDDTFDLPQDHSRILSPSNCAGSYFKGRKRSDSSRDSLVLALGASCSPPRLSSPSGAPVLSKSRIAIPSPRVPSPSRTPAPSPQRSSTNERAPVPSPPGSPSVSQLREDDQLDHSFVSAVSSMPRQESVSIPGNNDKNFSPHQESPLPNIENSCVQSKGSILNPPMREENGSDSNIRDGSMHQEASTGSSRDVAASTHPKNIIPHVNKPQTEITTQLPALGAVPSVLELVTSGDRGMVRKRGKVRRTAKEVQETESQAFKELGENDSQASSLGFSDFQCLASPVREKSDSKQSERRISPVKLRQLQIKAKFTGPSHPREVQEVVKSRKQYLSK